MSQSEKEKFIGFMQQLEGIRARRKVLEEAAMATYRAIADAGIDVLVLKAANQCKYSCVNDDALFAVYKLFSKNMHRKGFKAKRAERQAGSQC
jgi:hypothetical protein